MTTPASSLHERLVQVADDVGKVLVDGFHFLALFAIGAATVWSAVSSFLGMMAQGHASIKDILLLFIYLELGAMVGIYFKTHHMPVRYLIYVAITALTRLLIDIASVEHQSGWQVVMAAGAILLLSGAVLVLRYGSYKFPSIANQDAGGLTDLADIKPAQGRGKRS